MFPLLSVLVLSAAPTPWAGAFHQAQHFEHVFVARKQLSLDELTGGELAQKETQMSPHSSHAVIWADPKQFKVIPAGKVRVRFFVETDDVHCSQPQNWCNHEWHLVLEDVSLLK